MKLRLIIVIIPVFMTLQSYNTHGQESITEPSKYSFTFHSGIPFYYANDRAGSERGRSIYLLLDKQLKPTLSIGIKPQFIQYYTADIINKYSYLNKHLDLTIQLKKQIINHRLFKLQLGGGIGISYSDYIPYARYYWGVFPGSLPGMISQYIFEIQPIIDPMADLQVPVTSSITFQMSGGIKTYFLNYAMNNTGLNYSNNDLFGLIYWGGGLRFKL